MNFQTALQLLQTISVILAILVAAGTVKSRGDGKNTMLVEMRKDIEHIKENTACVPAQTNLLTQHQTKIENLERRTDEHVALYHQNKEEK